MRKVNVAVPSRASNGPLYVNENTVEMCIRDSHNITGADRQALLLETLRVLKKGGVFALNDEMKPRLYGDMVAFAQKLRDMGYEEVRLVDTVREIFGHRRAARLMLGASRLLVGRK